MQNALMALLGTGVIALWALILVALRMATADRRAPHQGRYGASPPSRREQRAAELLGRALDDRRARAAAQQPPAQPTPATEAEPGVAPREEVRAADR